MTLTIYRWTYKFVIDIN